MFWENGQQIRITCPVCGQEAHTGGDHRWVYNCSCPAGHEWRVEKTAAMWAAMKDAGIAEAQVHVRKGERDSFGDALGNVAGFVD